LQNYEKSTTYENLCCFETKTFFAKNLVISNIFRTFALQFWEKHNKKSIKMYAIVDIAGQQFKVTKDQKHFVHRLEAEVGDTVEFENVLLTDENGTITIGEPFVAGKKVTAKVLMQTRGEKVIIFKKKRRKGYRKTNGHRDYITQIQIESIN
jgi:large subunit ribosomal protein L21